MQIITSKIAPGYKSELIVTGSLVMAFFGECMGVALVKTDPSQLKLSFIILVENDGAWNEFHGHQIDSYWLPEMIDIFNAASGWLKINARKSKDGCGWEAKK